MAHKVADQVPGHLPLKQELLPPGMAALSAGDEKVQRAAEMLRNPTTLLQELSPAPLFDAYSHSSARLQDLMQELQKKNISIQDLRNLKQLIRGQENDLDLEAHPEIKAQLTLCIEQHGLVVTPGKTKYNKDELKALIDSINDCADNHSDTGDIYRLKFKKASSDLDVLVRLISEWLSAQGSRAIAVVNNLRPH